MRFVLTTLILGLLGAALPANGQIRPAGPCPDTLELRQQFLDGELEEVYSVWQNYLHRAQVGLLGIESGCFANGLKTMSILNLRLPTKKDTDLALNYWATILKVRPRLEMWDLWLPIETQSLWDDFRGLHARPRTVEEIWADRWLPPIDSSSNRDPDGLSLKKAYHRNRLLYANAGVDAENYFKIIENIRPLRDPSFTLFRTDVMLRLGMNVSQSRMELDKYNGQTSKILSQYDLVEWCTRLSGRLKEREESLEPKDTTKPKDLPPSVKAKLKLAKRKKE
jgi:hypothetical protein